MKKKIHINRIGYMIGMPKTASCVCQGGIFYLVNARNGANVYAGRLSRPVYDKESGDTVCTADFSDFNESGKYYIRTGFRRSDTFEITRRPYTRIKGLVLQNLYFNRCGFDFYSDITDVRASLPYIHRQCHMNSVALYGNSEIRREVSGGWHANGTYNRYVMSAAVALAHMIYALKVFPDSFSRAEQHMIEKELHWGLDWLMKMQDTDGGVFHKVSTVRSGDFTSPEEDREEYAVFPKSCKATVYFTAVCALAAGYFENSEKDYSSKLRKAVERSWLWSASSPEYAVFIGEKDHAGDEADKMDISEFFWAMCEMYDLTGDESFREIVQKTYRYTDLSGFDVGKTGGLGALCFLISERSHDRAMESMLRKLLTDAADRMYIAVRSSGYGTARSVNGGYVYGSNALVLSDAMCFAAAYLVSGDERYLDGAAMQFSYIFGRNPVSTSFMTGSCEGCVTRPYHRLSASDGIEVPVSGMIVSGPNVERNDGYSIWHIEKGTPPAKCYLDNEYSYSTNEPATHYATPALVMSAFFEKPGRSVLTRRSINTDPDIVSD